MRQDRPVADDSWAGRPAVSPTGASESVDADLGGPNRTESRVLVVGYLVSLLGASFLVAVPMKQAIESNSAPSGGFLITFALLFVMAMGMEAVRFRVVRRTGGRPWRRTQRADIQFAMSAVRNSGWPRVPLLSVLVTAAVVYTALFASLVFQSFGT